jgi:hypothetical protein
MYNSSPTGVDVAGACLFQHAYKFALFQLQPSLLMDATWEKKRLIACGDLLQPYRR